MGKVHDGQITRAASRPLSPTTAELFNARSFLAPFGSAPSECRYNASGSWEHGHRYFVMALKLQENVVGTLKEIQAVYGKLTPGEWRMDLRIVFVGEEFNYNEMMYDLMVTCSFTMVDEF